MRPKVNKGGRPTFVPTKEMRSMVEALSGSGMAHQKIMMLVENPSTKKRISAPVFYRVFANELVTGIAKCEALMIGTINKAALKGNWSAAAFWLTRRAGWADKTVITGPNGGPVQAEVTVHGDAAVAALAGVKQLLDELAARKSVGDVGPDYVAEHGKAQPDHPEG